MATEEENSASAIQKCRLSTSIIDNSGGVVCVQLQVIMIALQIFISVHRVQLLAMICPLSHFRGVNAFGDTRD